VACSTCHDPARAFTDGRPSSIGIQGRLGRRNAPTILNALYNKTGGPPAEGRPISPNGCEVEEQGRGSPAVAGGAWPSPAAVEDRLPCRPGGRDAGACRSRIEARQWSPAAPCGSACRALRAAASAVPCGRLRSLGVFEDRLAAPGRALRALLPWSRGGCRRLPAAAEARGGRGAPAVVEGSPACRRCGASGGLGSPAGRWNASG